VEVLEDRLAQTAGEADAHHLGHRQHRAHAADQRQVLGKEDDFWGRFLFLFFIISIYKNDFSKVFFLLFINFFFGILTSFIKFIFLLENEHFLQNYFL
jgi:hypothetical protein